MGGRTYKGDIPMEEYLKITIETYNQIAQEYISLTRDTRPEREFEAFCNSVVPKGLILDVGCAWGRDCKAFSERGFSVIGVDLSSEMIKAAKEFAPACSFIQADTRCLPLKDEQVDGIWCSATLLHLRRSEISKALLELKRVLKVGSPCFLQVKKGSGEEITVRGLPSGEPRFFTYFHEDQLREYICSAGFSILDEHEYNEQDRFGPKRRDQEWICFLIQKE
jgi:ubiquinone/menaquinone biosynthesis C-methylase UbiE